MNYIYKIYGDDRKKGVKFLTLKYTKEEAEKFVNELDANIYYKALIVKLDMIDKIPEVSMIKYLKNEEELKQDLEREKWQREFKERIKRKQEEYYKNLKK